MKKKAIAYFISLALIIIGFAMPPPAEIHPSVLTAVGIIIGGAELLFGSSIKEITVDKNGLHFEKFQD